jgi:hypothetical protein
MRSAVVVTLTYLVVMTGWIYGVLNMTSGNGGRWSLPIVALLHIVLGFAIGRWWAPVVSLAPVIIALPAGDPEIVPSNAEPFPISVSIAFWQLFAAPLVLLGVALRKVSGIEKVS